MGGVPRSQGCQTCKQRKIKCDETWPSCAQCRHLGATCPGPTALVKFVNSKTPPSNAAKLPSRPAPPSKPWKFAADSKDVRSKKVHYAKVDDSAAGSYGLLFFGKPKSMPTTLAERIANRLTTKMQGSQHGVTSLHMSYLVFTPQRLAESACLRDAVDCFCSAWSDFQSREPRGELIALPQYGKALRSVRRALLSPSEALKTETLAAITIMERACTLFDRQNSVSIHLKGIVQLILNKGPPDLTDDLDVAVSNESHSALMPTWVYGESVAFLTKSPWKEVLDECAISHSRLQGLDWKFLSLDDALILYGYAKGIPERRKEFQELFLGPVSDQTKDSSIALMNQLMPVYNHVAELAAQARVKGLEVGELTESPNPGGLTKMRYSFISALLALTFQAMIVGQMNMLHMLIQLNKLGGDDPELGASLWAQYRSAAQDFWKFLPYFYELESVVAWHFLPSLCLTWEAAEEEREQEAILNMVQYMDSYLRRWSKEPNIIKISILETAKLLTGRRPDLAIL